MNNINIHSYIIKQKIKISCPAKIFTMALISPESSDHNPIYFRAPPPSPVASGRRSSVTNDDVLSNFLQHSLHVPNLTLPDKVFPRQKPIQNPPKIDFRNLTDAVQEILDSVSGTGCFQLVNHGIRGEVVKSVKRAGAGVFGLSPEKKAAVMRSPEKVYGFEEFRGEDEREMEEEFVWCIDEGLELEMEGVWPLGYSNFSNKMERLLVEIEKVAGKILQVLKEHTMKNPVCENGMITKGEEMTKSICYLYKHCSNNNGDEWASTLKYDVIRMLVRGSDHSHALCLHLCDGSSEFHVYSKKGWVSFCPDKDALVITIGDQIQAWSGGKYKHVIGRPIFKGGGEEQCISMAFLYSPPNINNIFKTSEGIKTISLGQQALVAILLTLVYHFWVYFT